MENLTIAIKISLFCTAVYACGWKGMVFHSLYNKTEYHIVKLSGRFLTKTRVAKRTDKNLCKPLFRCLICMSSFWTTLFWFVCRFDFNIVKTVFTVCGINVLITALISNLIPGETGETSEQ